MKKRIILIVFAFIIISSFSLTYKRKKPETNEKAVEISEFEPKKEEIDMEKKERVKNDKKEIIQEEKVEKVMEKKESPEYIKNLLALNEKYKDNWRYSSSSSSSSYATTGPIRPGITQPSPISTNTNYSSNITSSPSTSPVPSRTTIPTSRGTGSVQSNTKNEGDTTKTNPYSAGGSQTENWNNSNENNEGGNENNSNTGVVKITRSISPFSGGAYVTLNIEVNQDISGLIITETIPSNYTITSSTPNYSKKTENSYKYLLYGKGISSQSITYTLQGEGGGTITGAYSTTNGSGSIEGQSTL